MSNDAARDIQKPLVRRFWGAARGFWSAPDSWKVAWLMTAALVALVVGQLVFQYQLNVWNRAIFDALEKKDAGTVLFLSTIYFAILAASVTVNVASAVKAKRSS